MSPNETDEIIDKPLPCQMCSLPLQVEPFGVVDFIGHFRNRLRSFFKRRWRYMINLFSEFLNRSNHCAERSNIDTEVLPLQPGDRVRVKTSAEIQETLNRWNRLKGCSFMDEMWQYCGTEQRVMKRVEKFLDERDYRVRKCKRLVILEGLICQGTRSFGACDRSCFYFWREEWLDKLN